ncbi:MAG: CocE/NonD family hydrolase [Bryobacteraceae bacterium]
MSISSRILGRVWNLPPAHTHRIMAVRGLHVPARDGVRLIADRYYPPGGERLPVVLVRSPYGRADLFQLVATQLAERGLQVLVQSCRGTGGSGGEMHPFFFEERDGLDTIVWLEQQPWYCGKLAAMGTSYLGSAAWALAHGAGPKVSALGVAMTLSDAHAESFAFGGFTLESCLEWTNTMMHPEGFNTTRMILERLLPSTQALEKLAGGFSTLPLCTADRVALGKTVSWWQDWMDHPGADNSFWTEVDYSATAAKMPPSVFVSGWYDVFLPWLVKDFMIARAAGRQVSLTVGPWKHTALAAVGATVREALPLFHSEFFGRPAPVRAPVQVHLVGAGKWLEFEQWPPEGTQPMALFLGKGGALDACAPEASEPSGYVYDPADPTPSVNGPTIGSRAAVGSMARLEERADVLQFTSQPLANGLDIAGPVYAELFFRSSCGHTDFYICVCDVHCGASSKNGQSTNVCDGYIRVRPGQAEVGADGVAKIRVELWPIAYRFRKRHCIRILVASGAHPRFARNHGTGEPFGDAVQFVRAQQEIFHDAAHPSHVVLPQLR